MIDIGRTIVEVAREIGVGEQLLGRWAAIERSRMDDPPGALDANERAELERLRRENAELRMDRGELNAMWTSDITYLATPRDGRLHLCATRDGCSRRVIGYAFSASLHTDVVQAALRRAIAFRDPATGPTIGVIFHVDYADTGLTPTAAVNTLPSRSPVSQQISRCACPQGGPGRAGTMPSRKASGPH